jgi:hypothetical protein
MMMCSPDVVKMVRGLNTFDNNAILD